MEHVNLKIDNRAVRVPEGTSLLRAAKSLGIEIPTLCHMHLDDLGIEHKPGGCRICVVEVAGRRNLAPACATDCAEGMVVQTNNIRVLNARKTVLELILSDHPFDCLICVKSGHCDLQSMAIRMGVRSIPYQGEKSTCKPDFSPAIIREMDKCIMCRRCETMCNDFQTVGVLSAVNRGFESVVTPAFQRDLVESECTYCGQCVAVCPTGALTEVDHTMRLVRDLADDAKTLVVQTAPAVRAALGEAFGLPPGTLVTGKMVAALRRLGFDYVFDTDFAADLTIMEEGTELLQRLTSHPGGGAGSKLPMLTSCCPGWVNFFEYHFPELRDIPSTARSPQQMFGAVAKSWFAGKIGLRREEMVVVSVMPCVAKKYECTRPEFSVEGNPDVDYSISTRELAALIKRSNIDFHSLPEEEFDLPMGESTGAAVIFGTTGGVIEAAVRTAFEIHTGQTLERVEFQQLRGMEGIRSATVDFGGINLNIGIAHGLGNARKLLENIKAGRNRFHAIEIMACPGGCVGGGGQPLHRGDSRVIMARQAAIYREDAGKPLRKSHLNPAVVKLYQEYLDKPLGEKSHRLLHTNYFDRTVKEIKLD